MYILTRFSEGSAVCITLTKNRKILSLLSAQALRFSSSLPRSGTLRTQFFFFFFFDPPRERHTGRGTETRRSSPPRKKRLTGGELSFPRKFHLSAKIPSRRSHSRRPSFFFLHARVSVASSSGHQTAEMGAVTLHSGLGNPTLHQRHNAHESPRPLERTRKYGHFWYRRFVQFTYKEILLPGQIAIGFVKENQMMQKKPCTIFRLQHFTAHVFSFSLTTQIVSP